MVQVIIPIKNFSMCKQRFSPFLNPEQRKALSLAMLLDVLSIVCNSPLIDRVFLVTSEKMINKHISKYKVDLITEPENAGLNSSLEMAVHLINPVRSDVIFVLHSDLPLLKESDLEIGLNALQYNNFILFPDKHFRGTNGLLSKFSKIPFRFGKSSLLKHVNAFKLKGFSYKLIMTPGIKNDMDYLTDLNQVLLKGRDTYTYKVMGRYGITALLNIHNQRNGGINELGNNYC